MKPINYSLFFIIILSVFLISSCKDDDCTDGSTKFHWSQNKSIEVDPESDSILMDDSLIYITDYFITDGQSNLFEFNRSFAACEDIADSGGGSTFAILIPVDSTESFSYRDQEILETSAFLRVSSASYFPSHSVEEGEITGTKLDEKNWRISIDVVTKPQDYAGYSEPDSIMIDEIFTLQ